MHKGGLGTRVSLPGTSSLPGLLLSSLAWGFSSLAVWKRQVDSSIQACSPSASPLLCLRSCFNRPPPPPITPAGRRTQELMMPAIENCVALSGPVGPTRLVGIITHKKCQTQTLLSCTQSTTDPGVQALVDPTLALGLGGENRRNSLVSNWVIPPACSQGPPGNITCHYQVC